MKESDLNVTEDDYPSDPMMKIIADALFQYSERTKADNDLNGAILSYMYGCTVCSLNMSFEELITNEEHEYIVFLASYVLETYQPKDGVNIDKVKTKLAKYFS
jgi:hypothetical protein